MRAVCIYVLWTIMAFVIVIDRF